jgi:glycosyltransferase involved in cell wall biosynthesis
MRILHLNVLYPPNIRGGAERFVATLAQTQAKRGHDVGVVTLSRGREPERPRMEDGVMVHRIGHANLFWFEDWEKHSAPVRYANKLLSNWNPVTLNRVRAVVASFKPDVMNTHCMLSFAVDSWKAASEKNIPIVHALHEFNLVCRNTNAFRNGQMCANICAACKYNVAKRWLSKDVTGVVGVSQDTLQRHLDYGYFGHIPQPLRRVVWSMPPIPLKERSAKDPKQPFTIGFIGRIVPEKGLDNLLEAVRRLPNKNWRLLIAGAISPPLDEAAMRASVAHLPVEWLGPVKAADFYPQIDLLVVPPVWADPGPLVVHEAFANSVPVIGSRMGGVTDMVEPGVSGWLFDAKDVDTLTSLLAARIEAGRAKLPPPENFKAFQQRTLADSVARQYEDLYQALIDKAAG